MSVEMISRRQIISRGRGNNAQQSNNNNSNVKQAPGSTSNSKKQSTKSRTTQQQQQQAMMMNNNNEPQHHESRDFNQQARMNQTRQVTAPPTSGSSTSHNKNTNKFASNDSSDGYAVNPYEEYGFADDLLDDEDEIENDYEDGDGYADFDNDNDPYGRVGDFGPLRQFQPEDSRANNNFYWQQKQQQAANLRSKQQQKASNNNNSHNPSQLAINANNNQNNIGGGQQEQQFDPYAIYAEEEDVWYSEERLLEDHLAEIFNRWDTLDDDIWCKLIIMERNRRIGKAYARVPLITIDGSYQLSYDGEKLALNGFDNPDRDSRTEECRRRIGKGIRIKMDNFGNVLITRRTKANIFIKEWLPLSAVLNSHNSPPNSLGDSSSAGSSSGVVDNYHHLSSAINKDLQSTTTPSRQQVIKNQHLLSQQRSNAMMQPITHRQPLNDSAICEEVISVGGRLEWEKIYVMFDMKKFQANITQELCQQFPDKRKLEQQCVSIVGLVGDSDEILNLPCWLMVINIVAIEILNERFPRDYSSPYMSTHMSTQLGNGRSAATGSTIKQPSFLSIFDQQQQQAEQQQSAKRSQRLGNKEEDPYSLPANASSSDVKSSINDGYGTTSTKYQHISTRPTHYQQQLTNNGNKVSRGSQQPAMSAAELMSAARTGAATAQRGVTSRDRSQPMRYQQQQQHHPQQQHHHTSAMITRPSAATTANGGSNVAPYNNSTSIYSPGHMLVLPPRTADGKPPKLPPRDFSKMAPGKLATAANSSSSKNLGNQNAEESIYSTGLLGSNAVDATSQEKPRIKTKKNRFLESLKAPLMNSSKSSSQTLGPKTEVSDKKSSKLKEKDSKTAKQSANSEKPAKATTKNSLKSFLGVKSSSASTSSSSGASSSPAKKHSIASSLSQQSKDITTSDNPSGKKLEPEVYSSVLDSTGDHSSQPASATSRSSSFNEDLDIPTPDYETDENIYAIGQHGAVKENLSKVGRLESGSKLQYKDDLYQYSAGYNMQHHDEVSNTGQKVSARENSRFMLHNKMLAAGSRPVTRIPGAISSSQLIYSSTLGLSQANPNVSRSVLNSQKSHFRSASMQRSSSQQRFPTYAPSSIHSTSAAYQTGAAAMSAGGLYQQQQQSHYGQGKYASPLHPAYTYNQQRYRHQLDHERDIYGRAGYVASSQQQLAENPYAMGGLRGHNYGSSMLNGPVLNHYQQQQQLHLQQQQQQMMHRTRRRSLSRLAGPGLKDSVSAIQQNPALLGPIEGSQHCPTNCCSSSNYDIGRSSSGIYGNNSSSSSSDYVDWHPQMRKVNSSGYLNSVFKNHHLILPNKQQAQQSSSTTATNNNNNNNNNNNETTTQTNGSNNNGKQNKSIHKENNHNRKDDNLNSSEQVTTTSNWKSAKTTTSGNNNNNNHNSHQDSDGGLNSRDLGDNNNLKQKQQAASSNAGASNSNSDPNTHSHSNYRLYDSSSNDSYTNSSDGLDIYDRIGQSSRLAGLVSNRLHQTTAPNQIGSKQQVNHQSRRTSSHPSQGTTNGSVVANGARMLQQQHHNIGNTTKTSNSNHEFIADGNNHNAALRHNLTASEIHVGEWENMYDR